MELLWEALEFAFQKHKGQVDLHGHDYRLHILRVTAGLSRQGVNKPEALAAAALHDVVEDCAVSIEEVEKRFGADVAGLVLLLTHDIGEATGVPYEEYIETLDKSRIARAIKLADLEDNSLTWREVDNGRKQAKYRAAIYRLRTGEWPKGV